MLTSDEARVRASVFPIAPLQLQFTSAVGLVTAMLLVFGDLTVEERIGLVLGASVVALAAVIGFAFADERTSANRLLIVPALDVLGLMLMIRELPTAGFGTLLAFPLIWLASTYSSRTVWIGTLVVMATIWIPRLDPISGHPMSREAFLVGVVTTCALAVVSAMTWWTRRRSDAQHVLLQRQTVMLEGAYDRTSAGEETLRQVLDAVQFAVLSFDPNGRLTIANRASNQLVRSLNLAPTDELTALPFYHEDGFTPVRPEESPILQAIAHHDIHDERYWLGHPGEARAALAVSTRALRDRTGRLTRVVLVAQDVTAQFEAVQARDDLFASVSHELRTPLSSIIGYVDLALESPELPSEATEQLEVVAKNADRMLLLVNDLLAHREREAAGTLTVTKVPMDLGPVVMDSVAAVMPMANDRLISVHVDLPGRLPVLGDALRLRQVIDNLLSNAIKYNRDGGDVDVIGTTREDTVQGPLVELAVRDTGRGMTPEETRRLFERFYRAPSVRQSAVRGSGLGLNISRELVDLHFGTIKVVSAPDVGTTMTVTLPSHVEAA